MTQQEKTGVIVKGLGGLYYAMDDSGTIHVLRAKGAFRRLGITSAYLSYTSGFFS